MTTQKEPKTQPKDVAPPSDKLKAALAGKNVSDLTVPLERGDRPGGKRRQSR